MRARGRPWLGPLAAGHTALVDFFQQQVIFSLWPQEQKATKDGEGWQKEQGEGLAFRSRSPPIG